MPIARRGMESSVAVVARGAAHWLLFGPVRARARTGLRKQRKRKGMHGEVRADHCVVFLILCKPCQNVARHRISLADGVGYQS
jgi:hypothetical protein